VIAPANAGEPTGDRRETTGKKALAIKDGGREHARTENCLKEVFEMLYQRHFTRKC